MLAGSSCIRAVVSASSRVDTEGRQPPRISRGMSTPDREAAASLAAGAPARHVHFQPAAFGDSLDLKDLCKAYVGMCTVSVWPARARRTQTKDPNRPKAQTPMLCGYVTLKEMTTKGPPLAPAFSVSSSISDCS